MKSLNRVTLVAIALSAISMAAYGAEPKSEKSSSKSSGATSFQKVDADGNGAVSMDEARLVPGLAEDFAKADKNGDGQLSKSEYEAAIKGKGKSSSKSESSGSSGSSGSSEK